MWGRRVVTIPGVLIACFACIALYLPVVLICLILSILPNLRSLPNVWTFICGYLIFEVLGVVRLAWVWLRYRNSDQWIYQNRLVQIWWACGLLDLGALVFRLEFEVSGQEALEGPSAILFVRHASMGDTVLPVYFFSRPRDMEGIRYLIKKELLISPSLDIAAHRLSTLFIDRSGFDTEGELERVAEITRTAPQDESMMIYPEGTRVTPKRRAQIRTKYPHLLEQLDRWPDLLPPRLGGPTALLSHNPGKDVVFVAHTGFEGLANLKELLSGAGKRKLVRIHMWRIPYKQIPEDFKEFMFSQWDTMQNIVASQMGKTQ
ncbi:MAG: 1-acyl-sn-glycerol-3-phosphate acyltransferase [Pseudomonadota bacterium]